MYSSNPINGIEQAIGFSLVSLAALITVGVLGENKLIDVVMKHGFITGLIYLCFCLANYDALLVQGFYGADLFFIGPEGHRSNSGRQLGFTAFFCLWMFIFSEQKTMRVVAVLGLFVSVCLIFMTWTRNPFLLLFVPSAAFLALKYKKFILPFIGAGFFSVYCLLSFADTLGVRRYIEYMMERGTSGRYDLMIHLITKVEDQGVQLFGLGIGSLDLINKDNYDILSRDTFHLIATYHETGFVGVILWLSLIFYSLLSLYRYRDKVSSSMLFSMCFVVYGFTNPSEAILIHFSGLITFILYLFISASLTHSRLLKQTSES